MNALLQATSYGDRLVGAALGLARAHHATAAHRKHHPVDLEPYRKALTQYARQWLRNEADVEDAVQDTLAAALSAPDGFAGRSTPKTWLHGILKHKIVDTYRRQAREPLREHDLENESLDEVNAMFTPDGRWSHAPTPWGDPEAALDQREFHAVLEGCVDSLPTNCARAFKMRERMGLEVSEICDVLDITPDNCYVLLHRARLRLRALLEERWFGVSASAPG